MEIKGNKQQFPSKNVFLVVESRYSKLVYFATSKILQICKLLTTQFAGLGSLCLCQSRTNQLCPSNTSRDMQHQCQRNDYQSETNNVQSRAQCMMEKMKSSCNINTSNSPFLSPLLHKTQRKYHCKRGRYECTLLRQSHV